MSFQRTIASLLILSVHPVFAEAPSTSIAFDADIVTGFLQDHCVKCHGPDKQKGKLRLDTLSLEIGNSGQVQPWQDVYAALNDGEMPPEDEPQPATEEEQPVLGHLKSTLKLATARFGPGHQYQSGDIEIAAASADEPKVEAFNKTTILAAAKYLDDGALAWKRERSCLACHTTGTYMIERPGLTPYLGKPNDEILRAYLNGGGKAPAAKKEGYPNGYKIIWNALGSAQVDKHVNGTTSENTRRALRSMFMQQREDGTWNHYSGVREIPHITTDFDLAVRAACAAAAAPGWLEELEDKELSTRVERMKTTLRDHKPRNDYERALKLQLANVMPDAVSAEHREEAVATLRRKQQADGGWSTRGMSAIDNWADWHPQKDRRNLEMLRAESAAEQSASDPYMTGFAIVLLRESGVPKTDPQIIRGIDWLKTNQRESGRWWMKSMYKETYHFSTYMGTAQALKALALCGELEETKAP